MEMKPQFEITMLTVSAGDMPGYRACSMDVPDVRGLLASEVITLATLARLGIEYDGASALRIGEVADNPHDIGRAERVLQVCAALASAAADLPRTRACDEREAQDRTWKGVAFADARSGAEQQRVAALFRELESLELKAREMSASSFAVMHRRAGAWIPLTWCRSVDALERVLATRRAKAPNKSMATT